MLCFGATRNKLTSCTIFNDLIYNFKKKTYIDNMKIATIKFLLRDTSRQLVKYALLGLCLKVDGHAKSYRIHMSPLVNLVTFYYLAYKQHTVSFFRLMIQCDDCDHWYHGECVEVMEEQPNTMDTFFCMICNVISKI